MNERPPVAVVFTTLDSAATVPALLDALATTDWPDLRVIAVDVGSTDGTRALLRAAMAKGRIDLLVLDAQDHGRASALNLGFAAAGALDVVRLHADVVPDGSDWLQRLHDVVRSEPDVGIVGAKLVLAGGRVESCGRSLISGLGIVPEWSDLRWMEGDVDEPSRPREVDGVHGGLCWIRRAALDATGGLDPGFDPCYGDDDDFCLQARWHGFRVLVEPAVRAVHHTVRLTALTHPVLPRDGALGRLLALRPQLQQAHREYFHAKWGFDPQAPDLHEVRRRYGHTRICWRIGARLCETLPERPAVDVCFVTYNSLAVLPRCLEHLAATRWPDVRVWITDNGSSDGTVAWLRERAATFPFPLHLEALPQNLGVAQGLNAAIRHGTAEVVARLDDDVFVPPDWLERLVPRFHQRPYAGMVGPRVHDDNDGGSLQNGPLREWPHALPGQGPNDGAAWDGLARVVTVRGCCNLYRRSVFTEVGPFDVRFSPSQMDEWDHHIACAVAGYEMLQDGAVVVRHRLQAGRMATPAALGNYAANLWKSNAKWGGAHWQALDRGIDLSIDGRLLPPDGDTRALYAALPAVPAGAPQPLPRAADDTKQRFQWARERAALRRLDGECAARFATYAERCRQQTRDGGPQAQALVMALMDLAGHHAASLMAIAEFRARGGEWQAARRTATWACRLQPDDAALAARAAAIAALPERTVLVPTAPRTPAQVLLVPPLDRSREAVRFAIDGVAAALQAAGIAFRIETKAVPDVRDVQVVHAFELGEASTWVGRLQVVRAMRPDCRIVVSPLVTDPGPANWIGHVVGQSLHQDENALRTLYAHVAAGRVDVDGHRTRHLPAAPDATAVLFERRCFRFVDAIVQHTDAAAHWLGARHPDAPHQHVLPDALDVPPAPWPVAEDVPFGQVLLLGTRDLPGQHHAAVLALADSGLAMTSFGALGMPFDDARTQQLGGPRLSLRGPADLATATAALARSAVFVWLPSDPVSLALPELALACGSQLVLARDVGLERHFAGRAAFVDPCDLPTLRTAVQMAQRRWRPPPAPATASPAVTRYGQALAALYGLPAGRRHHPEPRPTSTCP